MPPDAGQQAGEPGRRHPLGRKRLRVLTLLEDTGSPLTANQVAERLGVHENTARFHLDGLVAEGLAARSAEQPARPGRPRVLFAATSERTAADERSYAVLAEMLASFVATRVAAVAPAAEEAGAAWGRSLTAAPPTGDEVSERDGGRLVVDTLARIGFDSHAEREGDRVRLEISRCPFLEVASRHQEVVCSLHLGLMRGVLEQGRAPLTAESLDPLVEPSRCVAHLRRAPRTGPQPGSRTARRSG